MKKAITLLAICASLGAYAAVKLGWSESVSEDLKTTDKVIRTRLCNSLTVNNETSVKVDRDKCLEEGQFTVIKKYLDENKYKDDKVQVTLLKVKIKVGSLSCYAKLTRRYEGIRVSSEGKIFKQRGGWEITDFNECESPAEALIKELKKASVGDSNVIEISEDDIPKDVLDNIWAYDVPFELADGYYDHKEGSPKYYKVMKDNEIIGYIEAADMNYTEDPEDVYVEVIHNKYGEIVVGVEDLW